MPNKKTENTVATTDITNFLLANGFDAWIDEMINQCIAQGQIGGRKYFVKRMKYPYSRKYYCGYIQTDGFLPKKYRYQLPFDVTYQNVTASHRIDQLCINGHLEEGYFIGFDTMDVAGAGWRLKDCLEVLKKAASALEKLGY